MLRNLQIINKFLLDLSLDTPFRCTISIGKGHIPPSLQAKCPGRSQVSVAFPHVVFTSVQEWQEHDRAALNPKVQ